MFKKDFKRLEASFTVESAVIIPLFTFIAVALIAMGFYIRNTVMVKSVCWKSAIKLERITTFKPEDEALLRASDDLKAELKAQGMFLKNIRTDVYRETGGDISVNVSADSSFVLPVFGRLGNIAVTERADTHNPATNMRRWHALGMVTGRK